MERGKETKMLPSGARGKLRDVVEIKGGMEGERNK